jgi:hypothetical protein
MNLVAKLRAFDRKSRQLTVDYPHAQRLPEQRSCFVSESI